MKKIGLIGGLGPEATLLYYKGIIAAFKDSYETTGFPTMSIESVNIREIFNLASAGKFDEAAEILVVAANRLRASGADFGAICSNSPHRHFDKIAPRTELPLISIVEATRRKAESLGLKKICLLGTKFTMSGEFYPKVFDSAGIELVVPTEDEQSYMQNKIFSELEIGLIKDKTRAEFLKIARRIEKESETEGVILGCTELPLIMSGEDFSGACLDTTQIHIDEIVEAAK